MSETEHLKSLSHQHVLAPGDAHAGEGLGRGSQAAPQGRDAPARQGLWAGSIGLAIGFAVPPWRTKASQQFWRAETGMEVRTETERVPGQSDTDRGACAVYGPPAHEAEYKHPYFIGVHLNSLVPDRLHSLNLFDGTEDEQSRTRLLAIMDQLNNKYGMSTLAPATMLTAFKAAPTRIAFHSIPDLF